MPARPTTDAIILAEIDRMAMLGHTARNIHQVIGSDPRLADRPNRPALRTVQERVRRARVQEAQDMSGQWTLASADPVSAGLVLDTIAAVIEDTGGGVHSLTVAHGRWVEAIRQARPDLPLFSAWYLARMYVRRQNDGKPTDDYDRFLAFAPWRSRDALELYVRVDPASRSTEGFSRMEAFLLPFLADFDFDTTAFYDDFAAACFHSDFDAATYFNDFDADIFDDKTDDKTGERPRDATDVAGPKTP